MLRIFYPDSLLSFQRFRIKTKRGEKKNTWEKKKSRVGVPRKKIESMKGQDK